MIDAEAVMDAREELVLGRQTHLHQLADKLREERVRRVVEPVLSGDASGADKASPDDVEYVRDLGLPARRGTRRIANPIPRGDPARAHVRPRGRVSSSRPNGT
ncbi:MAG: hypothetical protein OXG72_00840 [Acidobacteria bacterium]|nr:hypothetical protein [Acidobacteriota bacterium]